MVIRPTATAALLASIALLAACAAPEQSVQKTTTVPLAPGRDPGPIALDPGRGQDIGYVYEAFLSPQQEPGEEKDTPALVPEVFQSTAPSLLRNERTSRGHGVIRFTKDLSRAYVDVKIENVKAEDVVMFHIHCGRPDMLGPIMVDFALVGDLKEQLEDGHLSMIITNEHIEDTLGHAHGLVGAFTVGCPINPGLPGDAKTIAGMQHIAEKGEIYFNLHTKAQTFYGDIRGQIRRVEPPAEPPATPPASSPPSGPEGGSTLPAPQ